MPGETRLGFLKSPPVTDHHDANVSLQQPIESISTVIFEVRTSVSPSAMLAPLRAEVRLLKGHAATRRLLREAAQDPEDDREQRGFVPEALAGIRTELEVEAKELRSIQTGYCRVMDGDTSWEVRRAIQEKYRGVWAPGQVYQSRGKGLACSDRHAQGRAGRAVFASARGYPRPRVWLTRVPR